MVESEWLDKSLKTIVKGAGVIFIGMIVGKVLGAGNQIVLARFLGADLYGLFNLGFSIIGIFIALATFGLSIGVTRFIAYYQGRNNEGAIKGSIIFSLRFSLILSLIFATILFLSSWQIANGIFKDERLCVVLQLFSIALFFMPLNDILSASFRGFKKPEYRVYTQDIGIRVLRLTLFLVFAYFGYLLYGAVIAFVVSGFLIMLASFYLLHKKVFPIFGSNIKSTSIGRSILAFSLPLTLNIVSYIFITETDKLLIGFLKIPIDVGLYSAAYAVASLLGFALASFGFIFLPVMSELYSMKKNSEFSHVYRLTAKWIVLIVSPLFLFTLFFSKEIIMLLYGSEYVAGSSALVLLALGFFVGSSFGLTFDVLSAIGKTKVILLTTVISAVTNVILNILLIPPFGIEGAAMGTMCSIALISILQLLFIHHSMVLHPFSKQYAKILLISVVMIIVITTGIGLLVSEVVYWHILIIFPLYFVLYLLAIAKAGCLEQEDKRILNAILKKMGMNL